MFFGLTQKDFCRKQSKSISLSLQTSLFTTSVCVDVADLMKYDCETFVDLARFELSYVAVYGVRSLR